MIVKTSRFANVWSQLKLWIAVARQFEVDEHLNYLI